MSKPKAPSSSKEPIPLPDDDTEAPLAHEPSHDDLARALMAGDEAATAKALRKLDELHNPLLEVLADLFDGDPVYGGLYPYRLKLVPRRRGRHLAWLSRSIRRARPRSYPRGPGRLDHHFKLEAKHTIDMVRFVDEDEIDSRYHEKPYYLVPDGDEADEGYTVIRDALQETRKIAIGQLIMHGREHLVGVKALGKGLALYILRYANELREPSRYFEGLTTEPDPKAVKLAAELIERESGGFEPEKMPDQYAAAIKEMIQAKIENRAPEVVIAERKPETAVINIMDALKESMQAKGRAKVRDTVRRRMGKPPLEEEAKPTPARRRRSARRTVH